MSLVEAPRPFSRWLLSLGPQPDGFHRIQDDESLEGALRTVWEAQWAPLPELVDAQMRPIVATFENSRNHVAEFIINLVCDFVDVTGDFEPSPATILAYLNAQRPRWTSATIAYESIVPILQFRSTELPVALEEGASIEPFTSEEKAELWSPLSSFAGLTTDHLRASHGKVVMRYEKPRSGSAQYGSDIGRVSWCALTALRLLKEGRVGAVIERHKLVGPFLHGGSSATWLPEFQLATHAYGEYVLNASDVGQFRDTYRHLRFLQTHNKLGGLGFALRRFNLSYTRDQPDDRIVDLVVALEATLLVGETQELKHRLALRGAALLRGTRAPSETFRELRSLYEARSRIVHSGEALDASSASAESRRVLRGRTPEALALAAETIVRNILGKCLTEVSKGHGLRTMVERLDAEALAGLESLGK